jgi:hypothetical protein
MLVMDILKASKIALRKPATAAPLRSRATVDTCHQIVREDTAVLHQATRSGPTTSLRPRSLRLQARVFQYLFREHGVTWTPLILINPDPVD